MDMTKKPTKSLPTYEAFLALLDKHTWTFNTDNFMDYSKAQREEQELMRLSMAGGPEYVRAFTRVQRDVLYRRVHEAETKVRQMLIARYDALIPTGDEEFDTFREKVRNHDFYYHYSDDVNVWRNGEERHKALIQTVKEKGGLYKTYWERVCKQVKI